MAYRYKTKKVDGKTVLVHRWVWEQAHGPIPPALVVHHVNGDKHDNRLENLELLTPQEHSEHHNQKHPITKRCEVCGSEFEPHPTKRARAKTCSWDCRNEMIRRNRWNRGAA